jgi:hypothetical protein
VNLIKRFIIWNLVTCCLIVPTRSYAGKIYPIVGRTRGVLAVQEAAAGPWRAVPVGGVLPDVAEVRTSADGPCQIHVDANDGVFLAPLSRVKYDLSARRVTLLSGRVFTTAPDGLGWTVFIGDTQVVGKAGGFETALIAENEFQVTSLRGPVKVTIPGAPTAGLTITGKGSNTWRDQRLVHGGGVRLVSDWEAQEAQLVAWTTPLPPGQGPGQLLITDPQSKARTRLAIARYHAELVLSPPVALVKLDQAFYNLLPTQQEGEFVFNLPPGASVSRFAMFVTPTQLVEGEVIDRRRANEVYSSIVNRQRDPAILEMIGDNLFRMRVFPIFARDIKRILLDYTLPLDGKSGQYHVQLPMLSDLEPIWDFRLHGAIHGPTPLASVQSPTHPEIPFTATGTDQIRFDFARQHFRPTTDFMLAFQQSGSEHPTTFRSLIAAPLKLNKDTSTFLTGTFVVPGPNGGVVVGDDPWNYKPATYFLADLPNPVTAAATAPASSIKSIDLLRPVLHTLIRNARPQDRLRLVCTDVSLRPLHEGWLMPGTPGIAKALDQFERQFCVGGNDMVTTCESVTSQFATSGDAEAVKIRRRVVVYVGEGISTRKDGRYIDPATALVACQNALLQSDTDFWAVDVIPAAKIELPAPTRSGGGSGGGFFQIGTGTQVGQSVQTDKYPLLLRSLAESSRGRSFEVADQPLDQARFFEWILTGCASSPSVAQVQVTSVDQNAVVEAADVYLSRAVSPGEPLRVTGRISPTSSLKIKYSMTHQNAAAVVQQVDLTANVDAADHLVGRYWASRRYDHLHQILSRESNGSSSSPSALDAIVRLSREWSLLTPYTSFLVLENEQEYVTWNVQRQARRTYWSAEGLPAIAPLPADWIAKAAPDKTRKSHQSTVQLKIDQGSPDSVKLMEARMLSARQAIDKGQFDEAARELDSVLGPQVKDNAEYRQMRLELDNARRQQEVLRQFGLRKNWFEPQTKPSLLLNVDSLLAISPAIPASFFKRHPHAEAFLRELDHPGGEISLAEFCRWLKARTGLQVIVSVDKLEEEAIKADTLLTVPPLKKVTLFTLLPLVLEPSQLMCVEHPRLLEITTRTYGGRPERRLFFSAQELLSKQPRFELREMTDPLLDRFDAAENTIEEKLRRSVTLKLKDATLEEVAEGIKKQLDINVYIDRVKLEEEAIATNTPDIDFDVEGMEMRDALEWLLKPKGLRLNIENEVLVISTRQAISASLPIRVYPANGLVHRSRSPQPIINPNRGFRGWGMGGGMGGMGGGMGGIGGGMGGMGGMGGGVLVPPSDALIEAQPAPATAPSTGGNTPAIVPDSANTVAAGPPPAAPGDAQPTPAATASPQSGQGDTPAAKDPNALPPPPPNTEYRYTAQPEIQSVMQLIGGDEKGSPWKMIDGEGGYIAYFGPSLSFVVRQTREAQEEIKDYFREVREVQATKGINPDYVPVKPQDSSQSTGFENPQPLMQLLLQITGGDENGSPWKMIDGEGGHLTWDRARYGIHVTQTPSALDEVSNVLLKLRRERYAALYNSRPWEKAIGQTGQGFSLIPPEWTSKPEASGGAGISTSKDNATPEELDILRVRRAHGSGTWAWSDIEGRSTRTLSLKRADSGALTLTWPGREIRVNQNTATVIASHLQFAEIGPWGESIRQWLDIEIPFWPHRSNQELAELFDVSRVPSKIDGATGQGGNTQGTQTLRFVPIDFRNLSTWIDITYDSTSRQPVEWQAMANGHVVQRLTFNLEPGTAGPNGAEILVCRSTAGDIGRWSASHEKNADPSPAESTDLPADYIVYDRRPGAARKPELPGIVSLQAGQLTPAVREFRATLASTPDQPLVKFLLAWSLDQQDAVVPKEDVMTAFSDAMSACPNEVRSFLINHGANRLSSQDVLRIIYRPQDQFRTADETLKMASWMYTSGFYDNAAQVADSGLKRQSLSDAERFELIQLLVNIRLRQSDLEAAIKLVDAWMTGPQIHPVTQIQQLLNLFESKSHLKGVAHWYDRVLQRADVQQLPPNERRKLYLWHANAMRWHSDLRLSRWASILAACELLPSSESRESRTEIEDLVAEIRTIPDLKSEDIAKLVDQAHVPSHRLEMQSVLADYTLNLQEATAIDWKLHQAGYAFEFNFGRVLTRMNQTMQFDKTIELAERRLRNKGRLNVLNEERVAEAYIQLNRPAAAARIRSTPYLGD